MLKLFVALINISTAPLRNTYNNALNVYRLMLLQTNRILYKVAESAFSSFFVRPMGGVVADRVIQSFSSNWLEV